MNKSELLIHATISMDLQGITMSRKKDNTKRLYIIETHPYNVLKVKKIKR